MIGFIGLERIFIVLWLSAVAKFIAGRQLVEADKQPKLPQFKKTNPASGLYLPSCNCSPLFHALAAKIYLFWHWAPRCPYPVFLGAAG